MSATNPVKNYLRFVSVEFMQIHINYNVANTNSH